MDIFDTIVRIGSKGLFIVFWCYADSLERNGWVGMENKIEIFDIAIDALTAKDTLKKIVQYMRSETLSTVEVVTLELLVQGQDNLEWKGQMNQMDLVLPGERDILDASESLDSHLLKELEKKVFLKMLLKYLQRSQKKVFLLAGREEELLLLKEKVRPLLRGMPEAGWALLPKDSGLEESIINEINSVEPDCILSVLPYPVQERFISGAKALLNARVWMGFGLSLIQEDQKKRPARKLRRFFLKREFLHLVDQQKGVQPAPLQSGRIQR